MVSMFWVHYKRKADGQEFHEQLTTGGVMKLLAQGGIVLCGSIAGTITKANRLVPAVSTRNRSVSLIG